MKLHFTTRIKATLIDQDSPLATTEVSVFPVVDNDLEGQPTHSSRKMGLLIKEDLGKNCLLFEVMSNFAK